MKPAALLERYGEERSQLLHLITDLLEKDTGVKAAWLFGSTGRGDDDELSDLDLWVVLDEHLLNHIIVQPRAYISQFGALSLYLEAPQNAPEGGAYAMACYDAPVAPHIVDWYWQPQSKAYIPGQVRILFDRVGLPRTDRPVQFPGRRGNKETLERPIHFISFFWMMLMITAKHAYRAPWAEQMELLPYLLDPIAKAQHLLGHESVLLPPNLPSHPSPGDKVQILYQLADQMNEMMASLSNQGVEVPALITSGAYRYLNMIGALISEK
jgi:predicted nucleotidyltransferase